MTAPLSYSRQLMRGFRRSEARLDVDTGYSDAVTIVMHTENTFLFATRSISPLATQSIGLRPSDKASYVHPMTKTPDDALPLPDRKPADLDVANRLIATQFPQGPTLKSGPSTPRAGTTAPSAWVRKC